MVGQHDAKTQKMFWILYPSTDWYGLGYIYFVCETLIYDGKTCLSTCSIIHYLLMYALYFLGKLYTQMFPIDCQS